VITKLSDEKSAVPKTFTPTSLATQLLAKVQLRINEMMTEINAVIRTMVDENVNLKKQIEGLTAEQQTSKL